MVTESAMRLINQCHLPDLHLLKRDNDIKLNIQCSSHSWDQTAFSWVQQIRFALVLQVVCACVCLMVMKPL